MNRKSTRKLLSALLASIMIITSVPAAWAAGEDKGEETGDKYQPGEVIVMFSEDAVEDSSDSLKKARALSEVSPAFGRSLMASGAEEEAAEDAKSETEILEEILEDDFVLEDSLTFADANTSATNDRKGMTLNAEEDEDGISIALVSSDKYDTEEMVEKLQASSRKHYFMENIVFFYFLTFMN